jgi:hypothetical protein
MDLKMKLMRTLNGGNLQLRYFPKLRKSLNQGLVNGFSELILSETG